MGVCKSQREWRTRREQGLVNELSKRHVDSRRLKHQTRADTDLHQVFCIYVITFRLLLSRDSLVCKHRGLRFLCLLYGFCSFGLFSLCKFDVMVFVIAYCTLFHHVFLLFLRSQFFPKERQKGGGTG